MSPLFLACILSRTWSLTWSGLPVTHSPTAHLPFLFSMLIIFASGCVLNESIWPMFSSVVPLKIYPWLDTHYRGSVPLFWDVPCLEGYLSVLVWTASHTLAHGSHILFLSLTMIIFARFSNGYLSIFESTASLSIPDTRISSFINPCGRSLRYSSEPTKDGGGTQPPLDHGHPPWQLVDCYWVRTVNTRQQVSE
jgi:hypothetical protein